MIGSILCNSLLFTKLARKLETASQSSFSGTSVDENHSINNWRISGKVVAPLNDSSSLFVTLTVFLQYEISFILKTD